MEAKDFKTLDQHRASFASNEVLRIVREYESNKEFLGKYKTRAKNFSSIVREDLLQGLVFYLSKQNSSDESFKVFLEQIAQWFTFLAERGYIKVDPTKIKSPESLISHITGLSAFEYLTMTNEAIQIGMWFKRFADALIEEEEGESQ